jgi:hypothetical protein
MATYLFKDANKAAFVNGVNTLFKKNGLNYEISSTDLLDAMPGKAEFTFYITSDPQEDDILKDAEKTKYFSFPFRSIDLQEMIKESKKLQSKRKLKK